MYPRHQTAPRIHPGAEAAERAREAYAPRDPLAVDPSGRRVYRLRPPPSRRPASARIRADLDPEQLAVVEGAGGRCLVLASAGTGKTRTIVATLAHLVEGGTPPEAVVLLTFTR